MVHVLQTMQNGVISRCCVAEDGKEMYQELQRTCASIVLLNLLFYRRYRSRSRRFLKLPNPRRRLQLSLNVF